MRSRLHTIRQIAALTRSVQEGLFHAHLVGVYRWDDIRHREPKAVQRDGRSYDQGRFHDRVEMVFGPFILLVLGPFEDERYPCGLARISVGSGGGPSVEGMLDATTWAKIADFIKQKRKEFDDEHPGSESRAITGAGADWGR